MNNIELAAMIDRLVRDHVEDERLRVEVSDGVATVFTRFPGKVIGRRGSTADSIRAAIVEETGRSIKLVIVEIDDDGGTPDRTRAPSPPEGPEGGLFSEDLFPPMDLRISAEDPPAAGHGPAGPVDR